MPTAQPSISTVIFLEAAILHRVQRQSDPSPQVFRDILRALSKGKTEQTHCQRVVVDRNVHEPTRAAEFANAVTLGYLLAATDGATRDDRLLPRRAQLACSCSCGRSQGIRPIGTESAQCLAAGHRRAGDAVWADAGLVNGATGTLIGYIFCKRQGAAVVVVFSRSTLAGSRFPACPDRS
jgi:hypothetical protein